MYEYAGSWREFRDILHWLILHWDFVHSEDMMSVAIKFC